MFFITTNYSILGRIDLFHTHSQSWYPQTNNTEIRYVTISIQSDRRQELTIYDSHIVDAPLVVPNKSQIDSVNTNVDVVFHEFGESGKFERFTANKRKIFTPQREL